MARRCSGVVLHPTSLPGPHGSGDFGPNAYYFIDWLEAAGQTLWQTLPLGPVGPGYSPYMGSSAFAGNPLLVAFEPMVERGWLDDNSLITSWNDSRIDYGDLVPWRMQKLRQAFAGFEQRASAAERADMAAWAQQQRAWLDDYTLFMTLDQAFGQRLWPTWPQGLARREEAALAQARQQHAQEIAFWTFVQWQFELQWQAIKRYANRKGIRLIGDLPIFVAHHSADCWARPDLYKLDASGMPQVVAGVPPDFFSATGQRWGNPLYNWEAMQRDGYAWWIARMRRQLHLADIVRIDHFRGFVDYWEIPADAPTAMHGRWQPGPCDALFDALSAAMGDLPIIAEDLGIITPEVTALRRRTGFPGMCILQFAFGGDAENSFLPHNHEPDSVVYTGTHDNDTVTGWWQSCGAHERAFATEYLDTDGQDVHWSMLRAASTSVANVALCQFQDILGLDSSHRMNTPGTMGCWSWRFKWNWVAADAAERMAKLTAAGGRVNIDRLQLPA